MRVMVVDDQEEFRALTRTMLEEDRDFQVVAEARDGDEAVELAEQARPDLVLMDILLGHMNGFEATRRILSLHPHVTVVLVSIYTDKEFSRAG